MAVKQDHRMAVQQASSWQIVVSIDWVTRCIEEEQIILNFEPFRITLANIVEPEIERPMQALLLDHPDSPNTTTTAYNTRLNKTRRSPTVDDTPTARSVRPRHREPKSVKKETSDDEDDIVWVRSVAPVTKPPGRRINNSSDISLRGMHTPPRTPSFSLGDAGPSRMIDGPARSASTLTALSAFEIDDDDSSVPSVSYHQARETRARKDDEDLYELSDDDDDEDDDTRENAEAGPSQPKTARSKTGQGQSIEIVRLDLVTDPAEKEQIIKQLVDTDRPEQLSRFNTLFDELESWKETGFEGLWKGFFQRIAAKVREIRNSNRVIYMC